MYYCLLNKFKLNNDYFNFLYYTFLNSQNNKEEAIQELSSIAWIITKEVTHGVNFSDANWVRGVYEFAYKFFKEELEQLLGIRKTMTTKTADKTPKTVYIKIYNNYDFSNYNGETYDTYVKLEKQDKELLIKYLCKVLSKKQYKYLVEVLEGKHSFSSSGKMSKKIKDLLATDTLLKYLKGE